MVFVPGIEMVKFCGCSATSTKCVLRDSEPDRLVCSAKYNELNERDVIFFLLTELINAGKWLRMKNYLYLCPRNARMAESVDATVSNTVGAIHPGSIPGPGTDNG